MYKMYKFAIVFYDSISQSNKHVHVYLTCICLLQFSGGEHPITRGSYLGQKWHAEAAATEWWGSLY